MKKVNILLALLLCICMGAGFVGCGSTPAEEQSASAAEDTGGAPVEKTKEEVPEPEEEGPVSYDIETSKDGEAKIIDSGYSYYNGYVSMGIVVANYNSEKGFQPQELAVTAYDKEGSVLGTTDAYFYPLQPGEVRAVQVSIDTKDNKPDRVEISDLMGELTDEEIDHVSSNNLIATNLSEHKNDYEVSFTGELENKGGSDVTNGAMVLLLKKDGKIVGAQEDFIENIPKRGKKAFETDVYEPPAYDDYVFISYDWSF